MKKKRCTAVIFLLLILLSAFSAFAVYADESSLVQSENQIIKDTDVNEKNDSNLFGKIAWIVVAIGVGFIIYLLIMLPKRKSGVYSSGMKYRRSPYKKNKKRIVQTQYYSYKRNKYDK